MPFFFIYMYYLVFPLLFFCSFLLLFSFLGAGREGEDCRVLLTVFVWVVEKSSLDGLIHGNPTTNLQATPRFFFIHIQKRKKKSTFDTHGATNSKKNKPAARTATMVLPESKNKVGLGRALMNSNRSARKVVGSGGRGRGRGSSGAGEVVCGTASFVAQIQSSG